MLVRVFVQRLQSTLAVLHCKGVIREQYRSCLKFAFFVAFKEGIPVKAEQTPLSKLHAVNQKPLRRRCKNHPARRPCLLKDDFQKCLPIAVFKVFSLPGECTGKTTLLIGNTKLERIGISAGILPGFAFFSRFDTPQSRCRKNLKIRLTVSSSLLPDKRQLQAVCNEIGVRTVRR